MVMEPHVPACARHDIVDDDHIGVYHCIARCVRRAFLCGIDLYSGRDYSHRKGWILDRLRHLAGLFGIEVCGYAIMRNHLHLVLRNRPDTVEKWSDAEVALRWCKLFRQRDEATGEPAEPEEADAAMVAADPNRLAILRGRLSSLSWFMRCLCEWVARAANNEDDSPGRFWAGRFKSQALLDEAALLACSVPILDRLGVDRSNWVQTVRDFGRMFKQAAGRASSLVQAAPRSSRRWFQGKAAAQMAFL